MFIQSRCYNCYNIHCSEGIKRCANAHLTYTLVNSILSLNAKNVSANRLITLCLISQWKWIYKRSLIIRIQWILWFMTAHSCGCWVERRLNRVNVEMPMKINNFVRLYNTRYDHNAENQILIWHSNKLSVG